MKKIKSILFFLAFIFVGSVAVANDSNIPVVNGNILFSDTIKSSLKKEEIKERLEKWSKENIPATDQRLIMGSVNDTVNNVMSYVVFEYMELEKTNWYIHSVYIKYHITQKYNDGYCITTIGRIGYSDSLSNADDLIPAKDILIDKKYKRFSFKNASELITAHTINKVFNFYGSLRKALE